MRCIENVSNPFQNKFLCGTRIAGLRSPITPRTITVLSTEEKKNNKNKNYIVCITRVREMCLNKKKKKKISRTVKSHQFVFLKHDYRSDD
jgi:hypothetical protein